MSFITSDSDDSSPCHSCCVPPEPKEDKPNSCSRSNCPGQETKAPNERPQCDTDSLCDSSISNLLSHMHRSFCNHLSNASENKRRTVPSRTIPNTLSNVSCKECSSQSRSVSPSSPVPQKYAWPAPKQKAANVCSFPQPPPQPQKSTICSRKPCMSCPVSPKRSLSVCIASPQISEESSQETSPILCPASKQKQVKPPCQQKPSMPSGSAEKSKFDPEGECPRATSSVRTCCMAKNKKEDVNGNKMKEVKDPTFTKKCKKKKCKTEGCCCMSSNKEKEKPCDCRFPPAFSDLFDCSGQVTGKCSCKPDK